MTDDLVTWLLEQNEADERIAGANAADLWPGETLQKVAECKTHYAWQPHDVSPQRIAHILRFGPNRVLAGANAKRRIIEECREAIDTFDGDHDQQPAADVAERVLKLLALDFADCPGYRAEWSPE